MSNTVTQAKTTTDPDGLAAYLKKPNSVVQGLNGEVFYRTNYTIGRDAVTEIYRENGWAIFNEKQDIIGGDIRIKNAPDCSPVLPTSTATFNTNSQARAAADDAAHQEVVAIRSGRANGIEVQPSFGRSASPIQYDVVPAKTIEQRTEVVEARIVQENERIKAGRLTVVAQNIHDHLDTHYGSAGPKAAHWMEVRFPERVHARASVPAVEM